MRTAIMLGTAMMADSLFRIAEILGGYEPKGITGRDSSFLAFIIFAMMIMDIIEWIDNLGE